MTQRAENPFVYPHVEHGNWEQQHSGMTLRDWFAGQALVGLLSAPTNSSYRLPVGATLPQVATRAYELSDAMLAARAGSRSS